VSCKKTGPDKKVLFLQQLQTTIMSERQLILSQPKNMVTMNAIMPKSVLVRVVGFFTETFDSIAAFVTKWTF
jgi:hypothetical protein